MTDAPPTGRRNPYGRMEVLATDQPEDRDIDQWHHQELRPRSPEQANGYVAGCHAEPELGLETVTLAVGRVDRSSEEAEPQRHLERLDALVHHDRAGPVGCADGQVQA